MRLGFCSNAFTRHDLAFAIDAVADAGYDAIEVLCDRPHHWPGDPDHTDPERIRGLAARIAKRGLTVGNVNANTAVGFYPIEVPENVFGPSLCSDEPRERSDRLEHVRGAIELARALGAPCISITAGAAGTDRPPERALSILEDSLTQILRWAEGGAIRVGIEAEPGLLIERSDEIARLCDRIGHRLLGFNLDVGHCVVAGEDPAEVIREHGPRIWHLHLEDIRDRKHFHRIPGEGEVDFAAIVAALDEVDFDGTASVELYAHKSDPVGAATAALRVLRPLFAAPRPGR